MPLRRSLFILFLCFCSYGGITIYAQTGSQIPLNEAIERLEQTFDVRFSYSRTEIEGVMVDYQDLEVLEAELKSLESQTTFVYNRISDRYYSVVKKDSGYRCAKLMAADSGLPLSEASVVSSDGTFMAIANENGYFHLPETVAGQELEVRYLGYETMFLSPSELGADCPVILMQTTFSTLNTVFINRFLVPGLSQETDGSISINTDRFGLLPGQVENDVLQIAQAIPGVQSVNESISNINIRGGTNDENLILWNGIKMYQNGHFFGLITAFNPDITRKVKVFKNGSPPMLGDGVSGSILMNSTDSPTQKLSGRAGLNLLNANLYLAVPLGSSLFLFALGVAGLKLPGLLGLRGRDEPHLLLELQEAVIHAGVAAAGLETHELGLQGVAGQGLVDLGGGHGAPLRLLDLLGHAVEGLEGGSVRETGHGLVDPLLGLGPLLLGDEEIPLPLGLVDLLVELAEGSLELLRLLGLGAPGPVQGSGPVGVLLVPDKGLLGQVVPALLHRQHGPLLPLLGLFDLFIELGAELALVGDGGGDFPLGLRQLVAHVQDDLIQHLLRVFGPVDQIVDVRLDDGRKL